MSSIRIPFNRPALLGSESQYMARAMASGSMCGDGPFTKQCHAWLEQRLGVHRALLTTSCTHALEMSALLLDIAPGDEVIVPSFTFVSTVNAFVLRGATPIFADIRPDTLNLDEQRLEDLISPRTKAIVVVHYAGVACEMDAILEIGNRYSIPVIEDNAHGLFGKYRDQELGTLGVMATQSFHETKNITCGEGGALLINDSRYASRAEILREKGTDRSRFFRGQVDKYQWTDLGSSYLPSDLLAAYLLAQLEQSEQIQQRRRQIWDRYNCELNEWMTDNAVITQTIPAHCSHTSHMFALLLPNLDIRQEFIRHMAKRGILTPFHYVPLHLSRMGLQLGGRPGLCPVTEQISDQLVRLPLFWSLTEEDQSEVIDAVKAFRVSRATWSDDRSYISRAA